MLALSVALGLTLYAIDVENVFQCTPKVDDNKNPPLLISLPPLYLHWFKKFPEVKLSPATQDVVQCLKLMQGTKPASRAFYKLMESVFKQHGIVPSSIGAGFFVCL